MEVRGNLLPPANGAMVMRSVASVCSVRALTFEKPCPRNFNFWYAGTPSEFLVQVPISRSQEKIYVTLTYKLKLDILTTHLRTKMNIL